MCQIRKLIYSRAACANRHLEKRHQLETHVHTPSILLSSFLSITSDQFGCLIRLSIFHGLRCVGHAFLWTRTSSYNQLYIYKNYRFGVLISSHKFELPQTQDIFQSIIFTWFRLGWLAEESYSSDSFQIVNCQLVPLGTMDCSLTFSSFPQTLHFWH